MCRQSPLPLYLSSYPSASSSLSSALPPCRARHDKRNTTRPEQCVLLFWGLHLTHGMSSYDRRSWFHLDTCDTTASTETSLTQHFNSIFQHVCNFGPLMCSLCEEALDSPSFAFSVCTATASGFVLWFRDVCYNMWREIPLRGHSACRETQLAELAHQDRRDAWLH